jgi:hypothetical protein
MCGEVMVGDKRMQPGQRSIVAADFGDLSGPGQ